MVKILILMGFLSVLPIIFLLLPVFCTHNKIKSLIIGIPTKKFLYETTWHNTNIKVTRCPILECNVEIEDISIYKKILLDVGMVIFMALFTISLILFGAHNNLLPNKYVPAYDNISTITQTIKSDTKVLTDFISDSYKEAIVKPITGILNNKPYVSEIFNLYYINVFSELCYLSLILIIYTIISKFIETITQYTNWGIDKIFYFLLILIVIFVVFRDIGTLIKIT